MRRQLCAVLQLTTALLPVKVAGMSIPDMGGRICGVCD